MKGSSRHNETTKKKILHRASWPLLDWLPCAATRRASPSPTTFSHKRPVAYIATILPHGTSGAGSSRISCWYGQHGAPQSFLLPLCIADSDGKGDDHPHELAADAHPLGMHPEHHPILNQGQLLVCDLIFDFHGIFDAVTRSVGLQPLSSSLIIKPRS